MTLPVAWECDESREHRSAGARAAGRVPRWMAAGLAFVLAALSGVQPVQAASNRSRMIAGVTAALSDERHTMIDDMSEAELQGAGCLVSGVAGSLAAYGVGANEVVLVVAGGMLVPSTPAVMGVVMLATIFTSGCAVGAIASPFFYWGYRQFMDTSDTQASEPAVSALPSGSPSAPSSAPIN